MSSVYFILVCFSCEICLFFMFSIISDSPAVPVSATSKELFRGFSYIAPTLDDVSLITMMSSILQGGRNFFNFRLPGVALVL